MLPWKKNNKNSQPPSAKPTTKWKKKKKIPISCVFAGPNCIPWLGPPCLGRSVKFSQVIIMLNHKIRRGKSRQEREKETERERERERERQGKWGGETKVLLWGSFALPPPPQKKNKQTNKQTNKTEGSWTVIPNCTPHKHDSHRGGNGNQDRCCETPWGVRAWFFFFFFFVEGMELSTQSLVCAQKTDRAAGWLSPWLVVGVVGGVGVGAQYQKQFLPSVK